MYTESWTPIIIQQRTVVRLPLRIIRAKTGYFSTYISPNQILKTIQKINYEDCTCVKSNLENSDKNTL